MDYKFDFNQVTYGEILAMQRLTGDDLEKETRKVMAATTVEWPFDMECTEESIASLGMLDFRNYQLVFSQEMERLFRFSDGSQ